MASRSARNARWPVVTRLLERARNVLNWSDVDKCILLALIILVFTSLYGVVEYEVVHDASLAPPWVDRHFFEVALRVQVAVIAAWLAFLVVAVLLRRSRPNGQSFVYVLCLLYVAEISYGSHFLGLHTSVYTGVVAVAGATVGFTLFARRPVLIASGLYFVATAVLTVAEQAGLIRYAPLLLEAPFTGGRLSGWWLVGVSGVTLLALLFVVALIYFVIESWHDREDKLARTSDQLARTNDIISRYVASQLAEQIKAGNYDAVQKHDRQKLTLFFSDIKDFAETADHIEPEDLSKVLNEYLSEMATIGERYDGTIDKFVGDAIMIFFGAPVATNDRDQALRAVRMAVEMQARMVALRENWLREGFERPFDIRIGINTGLASVGNFGSTGRMDYTAIGRQVNLAARLQTHCEPGKILISHSTWVFVEAHVTCAAKGEIQVKGFQNPVKVYEVVGLRTPSVGTTSARTASGA